MKAYKETIRKYYKYVSWTQPNLTSDTSYGTVTSSVTTWNDSPVWQLFDGVAGTSNKWGGDASSANVVWELPEKIKINSFKAYQTNKTSVLSRFPQSITLYASNDGTNYVQVGSLSGYSQPESASYVTVNCNTSQAYKYYKWDFGTSWVGNKIAVSEITITGQIGQESTSSDYDYYEDVDEYKAFKQTTRKYYKYQIWTQPSALTANGTMGGNTFACNQSAYYTETDGSKQEAWRAFKTDFSVNNGEWQVNNVNLNTWYYIEWYNPIALTITNLKIYNGQSPYVVKDYILYGSNDYNSWIEITNGTNTKTSTGSWNIVIPSNQQTYFKYWKLNCKPTNKISMMISRIIISAYTGISESTSSDYDFYKDVDVYKAFKI